MKKLITIGLALVLALALATPALAQSSIEPSEVNIVLPPGQTATVDKTVEVTDVEPTDVWWELSGDTADLDVTLAPAGYIGVTSLNSPLSFTETIEVVSGPGPLYVTVTFKKGQQGISETVIGTQTISVTEGFLDIKAGSYPNSINTKSNGVIPVALLGTDTFDVTTVDVTTLRFGPNDAQPKHDLTDPDVYAEHLQDVNYDGYTDLVSHYKTKQTGIALGQTSAELDYEVSGVPTTVDDSIRVIK